MNKFLEFAKDFTGCDNAEIICKRNENTWCLIVCTCVDDDGYCHVWLLRIWDNPFSSEPNISVDYHDTTRIEDADAHMAALGRSIAKMITE